MRHGERIDFTFGHWIPYCFGKNGYTRKDLNMPDSIPNRKKGSQAYHRDSPLTKIGVYQAELAGEGFKENGETVRFAYCSPAFRSIQTCDGVLRTLGLKDSVPIKVEPSLFEWMEWYTDGNLDFLTNEELIDAGYNIDTKYKPLVSKEELMGQRSKEKLEEFYGRNYELTKKVIELHKTGNILLVGHSCTLEVCNRQLLGQEPRNLNELMKIVSNVPYCAVTCVQQNDGGQWELIQPPTTGITHTSNSRFDWKMIVQEKSEN